jgi:thiosulfate dehydrogenase [quinone] large subunit
VLPLRAFLGLTFIYAGLQKLAYRWFFKSSAPSSLPSQLRATAHTSPIGGFTSGLAHVALPLGLLIAFGELAVGLGTLLGLWTRIAAFGGLLLSLGFLFTVSWHSRPFYYGADIVFVFAWTPLIISGAGSRSLDAMAVGEARTELRLPSSTTVAIDFQSVQRMCGQFDHGRCRAQRGKKCRPLGCPVLPAPTPAATRAELDRRTFLRRAGLAGWVGGLAAMTGGLVAVAGRLISPKAGGVPTPPLSLSPPTTLPAGSPAPTGAPASTGAGAGGAGGGGAAGTAIGAASAVNVGSAASFTDPATGDPAYVVQPSSGRYLAFDAVCTHAGCPVEFAGSQFQCPCHGAVFDAATGAVLRGPANRPLRSIQVSVGSDGQLYAT